MVVVVMWCGVVEQEQENVVVVVVLVWCGVVWWGVVGWRWGWW